MHLVLQLPLVGVTVAVAYLAFVQINLYRKRHSNGCRPAPHACWWDPVLGLKHFIPMAKSMSEHRHLEWFDNMFYRYGATFEIGLFGDLFHFTMDPENLRAILSTKFADWDGGPRRRYAMRELFGIGVLATDGEEWAHARALARPQLARSHFADVAPFERHLQIWFDCMREPVAAGRPVDLQEWAHRFALDVGTELLSGRSPETLRPDGAAFGRRFLWAADKMGTVVADRLRYGQNMAFLAYDPKFKEAISIMYEQVYRVAQEAIESHKEGKTTVGDDKRYSLPLALTEEGLPAEAVRDHIMNLLFATTGTTAALISNVFFVLAKHPHVQKRLRAEISEYLGGRLPTYDDVKNMKYLSWVLKESLRLYPPVPQNARYANKDTVLPKGGGPDGQSPIFIPKGREILYSMYSLHRRKDLWGEDAHEFKPERWETGRPMWNYIPFSGGPRICIGQSLGLAESGYVVVRFMQEFSVFKGPDPPQVWTEKLNLTCSIKQGAWVTLGRE